MTLETTADLAAFFNPDEFGQVATIDGVAVPCLFQNGYQERLGMAGTSPHLVCQAALVSAVQRGTPVVVAGVQYVVAELRPDGTGLATVQLEEV